MPDNDNKDAGAANEPAKTDPKTEQLRINRAFWLAIFGLTLAAIVAVTLFFGGMDEASDLTSVVGLFTSVLGTLVGAFFGLQIGSAGKEEAEERANETQKNLNVLAAAADPDTITRARDMYKDLFNK